MYKNHIDGPRLLERSSLELDLNIPEFRLIMDINDELTLLEELC
jgi:hypothetical protein